MHSKSKHSLHLQTRNGRFFLHSHKKNLHYKVNMCNCKKIKIKLLTSLPRRTCPPVCFFSGCFSTFFSWAGPTCDSANKTIQYTVPRGWESTQTLSCNALPCNTFWLKHWQLETYNSNSEQLHQKLQNSGVKKPSNTVYVKLTNHQAQNLNNT